MHFLVLAFTPVQVSQAVGMFEVFFRLTVLFTAFLIFSLISMLVVAMARRGSIRSSLDLYLASSMAAALAYFLVPFSLVVSDGFSVLIVLISGAMMLLGFSVQWASIWVVVRLRISVFVYACLSLGLFGSGVFVFLRGV